MSLGQTPWLEMGGEPGQAQRGLRRWRSGCEISEGNRNSSPDFSGMVLASGGGDSNQVRMLILKLCDAGSANKQLRASQVLSSPSEDQRCRCPRKDRIEAFWPEFVWEVSEVTGVLS